MQCGFTTAGSLQHANIVEQKLNLILFLCNDITGFRDLIRQWMHRLQSPLCACPAR